MNKRLVGLIITAVSTVGGVLSFAGRLAFLGSARTYVELVILIAGIVGCALVGAGTFSRLKSIALSGWKMAFFPLNVILGIFTFFVALFSILVCPVVLALPAYLKD